MENKQTPTISKHCPECNTHKHLETEFYRAGQYYQKLCKICHNANRLNYSNNTRYEKRITGFKKLPQHKQDAITTAFNEKKPLKHIARENDISYMTLRSWVKKNQIPVIEKNSNQ